MCRERRSEGNYLVAGRNVVLALSTVIVVSEEQLAMHKPCCTTYEGKRGIHQVAPRRHAQRLNRGLVERLELLRSERVVVEAREAVGWPGRPCRPGCAIRAVRPV